jgi:hypothetical protein
MQEKFWTVGLGPPEEQQECWGLRRMGFLTQMGSCSRHEDQKKNRLVLSPQKVARR